MLQLIRRGGKMTRLVTEAALGAGVAYLFDPEQGAQRRAHLVASGRSFATERWARRRPGHVVAQGSPTIGAPTAEVPERGTDA